MRIPSTPAISVRFLLPLACTAMLLMLASAASAQNGFGATTGAAYQKYLYEVAKETQKLLQTVGRFQRVDPTLMSALNSQMTALKYMSYEEANSMAFVGVDGALVELRQQIKELNRLLTEHADEIDLQVLGTNYSNGFGNTPDCPASGHLYQSNPPGPCGQIDLSGQVSLSDSGYPYLCFRSFRPAVLVAARLALALIKGVALLSERVCYQAAFGANAANACIVQEIVWAVLRQIFTFANNCNGQRGDAEAFVAYARLSEIFVANRINFSNQNAAMAATLTTVKDAETSLLNDVAQARAKMEASLDAGFSSTEARLTELETQAVQNSQQLDQVFVEQRAIMRELGIEHLYQDPNTVPPTGNSYQLEIKSLEPRKHERQFDGYDGDIDDISAGESR